MVKFRVATWLCLASVFLFGLLKLATLPPFEAFDEAQYWSAIQQLADTHKRPRYGEARLSADVAAYPGALPSSSGQPYATFFSRVHEASPWSSGPSRYVPGDTLNYEAQHPPLFFRLMAPLYRVAAPLPWPAHFLVLRIACWTVAFLGFAMGAYATQGVLLRRGLRGVILMLPMAWPFLFLQFFEEFTRVTNDTLCLALIGVIWSVLVGVVERNADWRRAVVLGVLLGAGLLTKAFFIPVGVGVTLLLLFVAWRRSRPHQWAPTLAVPVLALLIGGLWYARAAAATGAFTGAGDFTQVEKYGGLLQTGLHRFPSTRALLVQAPALYLAGLLRMLVGFRWAGTWSFVHPPRVFALPVVALAILPSGLYLWRVRRTELVELAPAFLVGPMLAGLLYHLAVKVAATGEGYGTPGWFFHLLAGPLTLAMALGWGSRVVMVPLAAYAFLHTAVMAWVQIAFFSGCLPRAGLEAVKLVDATCVASTANLRLLAFPDLTLLAGVLAVILLAVTAALLTARPATRQRAIPAA
jgi:hypothetical protein